MTEPRLVSRDVDELLGIARALAEKASLDEDDVDILSRWMKQNRRAQTYPIVRGVRSLLEPSSIGNLSTTHGRSLLHLRLRQLCGVNGSAWPEKPTSSVFDDPVPKLEFANKRYCFTGTFAFGTRQKCEAAVEARGAHHGGIARKTDYLIVGSDLTDSWKHSSFGTKIREATAWNASGVSQVAIIREVDWVEQMQGHAARPRPTPSHPPRPGTSEATSQPSVWMNHSAEVFEVPSPTDGSIPHPTPTTPTARDTRHGIFGSVTMDTHSEAELLANGMRNLRVIDVSINLKFLLYFILVLFLVIAFLSGWLMAH